MSSVTKYNGTVSSEEVLQDLIDNDPNLPQIIATLESLAENSEKNTPQTVLKYAEKVGQLEWKKQKCLHNGLSEEEFYSQNEPLVQSMDESYDSVLNRYSEMDECWKDVVGLIDSMNRT